MSDRIIVIGGGIVGGAIAFGLARAGHRVTVIAEDDSAIIAARANFGLTWVHTKGLGTHPYFLLSRDSVALWQAFADELTDVSGIDPAFEHRGGLLICVGDAEAEKRKASIEAFRRQLGDETYEAEFVDRAGLQGLLPDAPLGDRVTGASFSPLDGQANPLFLLRALNTAITRLGGCLQPGYRVSGIARNGAGYDVLAGSRTFRADKVVIAAGLGAGELARTVGMSLPIKPERGQILVTERTGPMFPLAMSGVRQTAEGTVMIGATYENVGLDTGTTVSGTRQILQRALQVFPTLGNLRLIRTWAGLRVLSPDGKPVYAESATHPGVYVAYCHSGVTLAGIHARKFPEWLSSGQIPGSFSSFGPERFHVSKNAGA